jgi:hypothetical protein
MFFHSIQSRSKPVLIDFLGTAPPTFLGLLSLDIVVVHFQLFRGLLLPLDSAEIVFSQPYFQYTMEATDRLPFEEVDELEFVPLFRFDYVRFLFGIIWGMGHSSINNQPGAFRELQTSFRWRLMRLNSQIRTRTHSSEERLHEIAQVSRETRLRTPSYLPV